MGKEVKKKKHCLMRMVSSLTTRSTSQLAWRKPFMVPKLRGKETGMEQTTVLVFGTYSVCFTIMNLPFSFLCNYLLTLTWLNRQLCTCCARLVRARASCSGMNCHDGVTGLALELEHLLMPDATSLETAMFAVDCASLLFGRPQLMGCSGEDHQDGVTPANHRCHSRWGCGTCRVAYGQGTGNGLDSNRGSCDWVTEGRQRIVHGLVKSSELTSSRRLSGDLAGEDSAAADSYRGGSLPAKCWAGVFSNFLFFYYFFFLRGGTVKPPTTIAHSHFSTPHSIRNHPHPVITILVNPLPEDHPDFTSRSAGWSPYQLDNIVSDSHTSLPRTLSVILGCDRWIIRVSTCNQLTELGIATETAPLKAGLHHNSRVSVPTQTRTQIHLLNDAFQIVACSILLDHVRS
ncbi:hypothetical protein VP01_1566g8 [Puccinia sorghi]|uniref:Uncharacterized protein n=1 Tax=Puccinia sorghi TaxID=27349 RepID=A0A0L6VHW6_9BASI|nr:hypothetical protein VP01_1566g8 [Puccinia sorghi]